MPYTRPSPRVKPAVPQLSRKASKKKESKKKKEASLLSIKTKDDKKQRMTMDVSFFKSNMTFKPTEPIKPFLTFVNFSSKDNPSAQLLSDVYLGEEDFVFKLKVQPKQGLNNPFGGTILSRFRQGSGGFRLWLQSTGHLEFVADGKTVRSTRTMEAGRKYILTLERYHGDIDLAIDDELWIRHAPNFTDDEATAVKQGADKVVPLMLGAHFMQTDDDRDLFNVGLFSGKLRSSRLYSGADAQRYWLQSDADSFDEDSGDSDTGLDSVLQARQSDGKSMAAVQASDAKKSSVTLIISIVSITFYFVLAYVGYSNLMGWGALDCMYFAIVTLTTVGYGDHHTLTEELDDAGKIFTICFLIFGLAIAAASLMVIIEFMLAKVRAAAKAKAKKNSGSNYNRAMVPDYRVDIRFVVGGKATVLHKRQRKLRKKLFVSALMDLERPLDKVNPTQTRLWRDRTFSSTGDSTEFAYIATTLVNCDSKLSGTKKLNFQETIKQNFQEKGKINFPNTTHKVLEVSIHPLQNYWKERWKALPGSARTIIKSSFLSFWLGLAGGIFFCYWEDLSAVDSLYFVVVTMSTVGYGDIYPTTDEGKAVCLLWIPMGVILLGKLLGSIFELVIENQERETIQKIIEQPLCQEDLVTADDDGTGTVTQAEYILFKLEQMGVVKPDVVYALVDQFTAAVDMTNRYSNKRTNFSLIDIGDYLKANSPRTLQPENQTFSDAGDTPRADADITIERAETRYR